MSPLDLQRMAVRSPQLANNLATRLGSSRMSVPPSGMPAVNRPPASLPVRPPSTMYPPSSASGTPRPPSYGPSQQEKAKQDAMMSRQPVYGPTPQEKARQDEMMSRQPVYGPSQQEKARQDEMMRIQPVGSIMPYSGDLQTALSTQQQMLPYTADLQTALNAQQQMQALQQPSTPYYDPAGDLQALNQMQGSLNALYSSPSSGPNPTLPYDPYEYERMLNDQRAAAAANMPGTAAGLQALTQQMAGPQQAGGGAQYSGSQTTLPSTLSSMTNSLSANQAALAQSANSVNSGIGALPYGSNLTRMG